MANEFEYYVIERAGNKAYPSVKTDDDSEHTTEYIYDNQENAIPNPEEMDFVFAEPYPRKPVIGDYFSQTESIVSEKIKDVLEPLKIKGIQLIPATVTSNKGAVYKNYYYIHIYRHIEAMDRETSKYEQRKNYCSIERFNLDKKILESIPLEERLIFKLKESSTKKLYHKSVVDAIMATNPEGVLFIKVEDWRF
ncbi:imm11 family protein [Breznakiellaceae bacterium SP9]